MNDYRCTQYCPPFSDIPSKKAEFLREIRKTHPHAKNIYLIVKKRDSEERKGFNRIYNNKCAYCGCSFDILSSKFFEIDHLHPKAGETIPVEEMNGIDNLVLACYDCNRGKTNCWFPELSKEWSPDGSGIANIFVRDALYNITIAPEFQSVPQICRLFQAMKLGEQYRRLDFLLMLMKGYRDTLPEGSEKRSILNEIYIKLLQKRNYVGI